MSRKTRITLIIITVLVTIVGGLLALTNYYNNLPNKISQHETIILGQNRFVPGSEAGLRVVVRDSKDSSPLEGAEISVSLRPRNGGKTVEVFQGTTDDQGSTDVIFSVPEEAEPNQILIVETKSDLGSDYVERDVTLDRDYRILLTTDKPLYQPGQEIHIRLLALSAFDLAPATEKEIEVVIADGKGNKVHRETLTTSKFGIASTDFQLAREVNNGNYKISATMGSTTSEKTVTVEHYVLPKFEIAIDTDRRFYTPGQTLEGTLSVNYFFGKPVAGGEVVIEGYTFDFERVVTVTLEGETDGNGNFEFSFKLPEYIAGSDLEGGLGRYYIQANVTDLAKHTEVSNLSLPVSSSTLVIEAIPEGGQFRPGVENILYVLTSYPDGTPAECTLTIDLFYPNEMIKAETGVYGLAEVRVIPEQSYQEFSITARDVAGNTATQYYYFEGDWQDETVLLRPDKPVYRVGETMTLTILTSQQSGTAYLDIVREGQTVSTQTVRVDGGEALVAVDLTPDLYGTLELHAYKILSQGNIVRDTRLVIVDNASDLALTLTPGQSTYRPGDMADLDILVQGNDSIGVKAAVGLAIVDESVFALAQQDPGFAKLYFMLEQELLVPKYDLHGFSIPALVKGVPVSAEPFVEAIEDAATASLASAIPKFVSFSLQANSHAEAEQRAYQIQQQYYTVVSKAFFGVALALPLVAFIYNGIIVWREKRLGRSLGLALGALFFFVLILVAWPHPWATTPLDKLGAFADWLSWNEGFLYGLLCGLGFLSLIGFIALILVAIREKDKALGLVMGIFPAFIIALILSIVFADRGDFYPSEGVAISLLIAFLLLPLTFGLRSANYAWGKKFIPAFASVVVGFFILIGTIPLLVISTLSFTLGGTTMLPGTVADEMFVEAGAMRMEIVEEAMPEAEVPAEVDMDKGADVGEPTSTEPPRLRQYFPETMFWLPDAVTDGNGNLHLDFEVADSITTWRMTALASTQDGRLGSTTAQLRVFQDFFIDLDLPIALTVGDEISVPVGVFNYLSEGQSVRLELEPGDWFELLDEKKGEQTVEIAANDINVVYFPVKVIDFGVQSFKVTAWGSQTSDAIMKSVRVYPNGKQIRLTESDRLNQGETINHTVFIPTEAISGTQTLSVKIYPGVVSQVVEGLDSILRMPNGCFEQTSSTTYPNVLVLDYLQTTGQTSPEVEFKAEEYINLGYQRLITFEVPGQPGGFSLFGDPPPDPVLTAYGLQEFNDMSRVHKVDPDLIARTAEWLLNEQDSDGSWKGVEGFHESGLTGQVSKLPVTAYVVWGLADAGYADDGRTQRGVNYLTEFQGQAEDAYTLALVANALVSFDMKIESKVSSSTEAVLDRLAGMAVLDGNSAYWSNETVTAMGSYGESGKLETTALASLAFLRSNSHAELANAGLNYLVQNKDNFGTWQTTQATVFSLKALLESVRAGAEKVDATVTVTINDEIVETVIVTPEKFDIVQEITFDNIFIGRENKVEIRIEGEGNLMYQVTGSYYLPWDVLPKYPDLVETLETVSIDVNYDRTELNVDDTVTVNVNISMNNGAAESAIIDLGLPPGFTVETSDLAALVAYYNDMPDSYEKPKLERFELTGRQIIIYLTNLSSEHGLEFSYRLRAKFPLRAQAPASNAYDYYNPDTSGLSLPQILEVSP